MSAFKIDELVAIVRVIDAINIARENSITPKELHAYVKSRVDRLNDDFYASVLREADTKLFSYGSLRPGGESAHVLEPLTGTWHAGHIHGRLIDSHSGSSKGFKVLVRDDKSPQRIEGEMLVSNELPAFWNTVDEFEGSDYVRTLALVYHDDGEKFDIACVYSASQNFQEANRRKKNSLKAVTPRIDR